MRSYEISDEKLIPERRKRKNREIPNEKVKLRSEALIKIRI